MLADNVFKYQIILGKKTFLPIIISAPYIFNLSTNSLYNNIKFKRLLINSRASTQSKKSID